MLSYPFDALQVSFQQAVQGKGDDVVHVLELTEGRRVERETETERERCQRSHQYVFFFINLMLRGSTKLERELSLKLPVIRFSN